MQPTTILKRLNPVQKPFVWIGAIAAIILYLSIVFTVGIRQGFFYLFGIALGVTLLHARFGFTSAFRGLVSVGNVRESRRIWLCLQSLQHCLLLYYPAGLALQEQCRVVMYLQWALVSLLGHLFLELGCRWAMAVLPERFIIWGAASLLWY